MVFDVRQRRRTNLVRGWAAGPPHSDWLLLLLLLTAGCTITNSSTTTNDASTKTKAKEGDIDSLRTFGKRDR